MPGLPVHVRQRIISHHENGFNYAEIADIETVNIKTVRLWVRRWLEDPDDILQDRPHTGRRRMTTAREDQAIVDLVHEIPFINSRQIVAELNMQCSPFTVRRRLHEQQLHHRIPAQQELLTEDHKIRRIAFAREHSEWRGEEWGKTVFCDEKVFSSDESGRVTLWRVNGSRRAREHIIERRRCGRITLAFWGWMSVAGPGELVEVSPRMNSNEYVQVLDEVMMPSVRALYPPEHRINFVQDNSPVHTAYVVQNWLREQENFNVLRWPAKSPDLNIIENVWAIMVARWGQQNIRTNEALRAHVFRVWEQLRDTPEMFRNMVASMPNRLQDVINSGGNWVR